jgi:FdhD protein
MSITHPNERQLSTTKVRLLPSSDESKNLSGQPTLTGVVLQANNQPILQHFRELDVLANEVPIALVINGISHAVMMATPDDLEDFALGFAITEGLIENEREIYDIEVTQVSQGVELKVTVSAATEWRLKDRRRTLAGRTGCGICGVDNLNLVHQKLCAVTPLRTEFDLIQKANQQMKLHQILQSRTGATHAASWANTQGEVILTREDVGRHNALDKLIGAMIKSNQNPQEGFICITSRASFEMIQKTIIARVGLLCAVSAPTALAVEIANKYNLRLAGFVRGESMVLYNEHI